MNEPNALSRRRFLTSAGLAALLSVALPGSLLAACGGSAKSGNTTSPTSPSTSTTLRTSAAASTTSSAAADESATLKFWMDIAGTSNQDYFNKNVVGAFEHVHPKIKLDITYYSGADLRRLIETALQARQGPDFRGGPSASRVLASTQAVSAQGPRDPYAPSAGWEARSPHGR